MRHACISKLIFLHVLGVQSNQKSISLLYYYRYVIFSGFFYSRINIDGVLLIDGYISLTLCIICSSYNIYIHDEVHA